VSVAVLAANYIPGSYMSKVGVLSRPKTGPMFLINMYCYYNVAGFSLENSLIAVIDMDIAIIIIVA
jgi:hypothetical protein